jgi:hypothetical protein
VSLVYWGSARLRFWYYNCGKTEDSRVVTRSRARCELRV